MHFLELIFDSKIFEVVIASVFGAVAGAISANKFAMKASRVATSNSFNQQFSDTYFTLYGDVKAILSSPSDSSLTNRQINSVLRLGVWFDQVANNINKEYCEPKLLNDVIHQMNQFWSEVTIQRWIPIFQPDAWTSIKKLSK